MFKTHMLFGFLIGLVMLSFLKPSNQILFMLIVLFSSALPDIDHPNSKIGRKVKVIGFLFEHRGFFHGLLAVALFGYLIHALLHSQIYLSAFLIGYISHLAADCLSVQGIMPLHPLSRFRIKGIVRTGSYLEYVLFVLILIADVWWLIRL